MTLPASGNFSLGDIVTELRTANPGRAFPISLGDADVRALAGKASGVVSMTDLRGKSAYVPMTVTGNNDERTVITSSGPGMASCTPSVTVANGDPAYSFLWAFVSNLAGFTLDTATGATCSISHGYARNQVGTVSATLQCTVTDSTGHSVTVSGITGTLDFDF